MSSTIAKQLLTRVFLTVRLIPNSYEHHWPGSTGARNPPRRGGGGLLPGSLSCPLLPKVPNQGAYLKSYRGPYYNLRYTPEIRAFGSSELDVGLGIPRYEILGSYKGMLEVCVSVCLSLSLSLSLPLSPPLYTHIYMYVYRYVFIHISLYTYACVYLYIYIYMCAYVHISIYTYNLHSAAYICIWSGSKTPCCRGPPSVTNLCRGPSVTKPLSRTSV